MTFKATTLAFGALATSFAAAGQLSKEENVKWEAGQMVKAAPEELLSDYLALTNAPAKRITSPSTPPKRTKAETPAEDAVVRARVARRDKTVVPALFEEALNGNKEAADLLVGFDLPPKGKSTPGDTAVMLALGEAMEKDGQAAFALDVARRRGRLEFRAYARRMLFSSKAEEVAAAARYLKDLGCAADVPKLVEALQAKPGEPKIADALVRTVIANPSTKHIFMDAEPSKDLDAALARISKAERTAEEKCGFKWLFDGTYASFANNWHGNERWWEVRDGLLTAESTPNRVCKRSSFLISNLVCQDFDWRTEFRLSYGGNSGLQFRGLDDPTGATGVQGDMDGVHPSWKMAHVGVLLQKANKDRNMWVLADRGHKVVYGADKKIKSDDVFAGSDELIALYRPGEWNEYRIVAEGPHIRAYVNGVLFSEMVDNWPGYVKAGHLALQMHPGPFMKVEYRNMRVKVLDR